MVQALTLISLQERKESIEVTQPNKIEDNTLDNMMEEDDQLMAEALQEQVNGLQLEKTPSQTCLYCMKYIGRDEAEMLLQSTDCFHIVHLACFRQQSITALTNGDILNCPSCDAEVSRVEMRGVLLPEEIEKIEQDQMKKFFD